MANLRPAPAGSVWVGVWAGGWAGGRVGDLVGDRARNWVRVWARVSTGGSLRRCAASNSVPATHVSMAMPTPAAG